MRADLQAAWSLARKTDGTIYKNPEPADIEPSLAADEKVLVILRCLKKWGNLGGGEVCTAVLTDKTIHIFSRGIMKSVNRTSETIPFSTITGVDLARKLSLGWVISFTRAANTDSLLKCDEEGAKKFVSELRAAMETSKRPETVNVLQQATDPLDQIKRLKELFDAGIISEQEYAEKRQSLLDKI